MPWYEHECTECGYEFEDLYGVNSPPPTICPNCGKEAVKRVISLTAPGVVELTGQDYKRKIKNDSKKLAKEVYSSEKLYANIVGDDKYQKVQKKLDNNKKR